MVNVNKLGQMKIQQTAFVLIALTLFFVLVGLFFLGFYLQSVKEDVSELNSRQAKLLVSKLANSPEFTCGTAFHSKYADCVDSDKVLILMQNSSRYKNFWGVDDIKIWKIHPSATHEECNVLTYPDCTTYNILESGTVGVYESNFISLCRIEQEGGKSYTKCELARLMVSYTKQT